MEAQGESVRRTVVVNQPALFPWLGEFEKLRLADVVVTLDDVQAQRRAFLRRYRMVLGASPRWLTVPHARCARDTLIEAVTLDESTDWRSMHLHALAAWYRGAPHRSDLLDLVASVYAHPCERARDLAIFSTDAVARYLGVPMPARTLSSSLGVEERASHRILRLVAAVGGSHYLYGLGGRSVDAHYLDRGLLERSGVSCVTMQYLDVPYRQAGAWVPRCSALDAIAWHGVRAAQLVRSEAHPWTTPD